MSNPKGDLLVVDDNLDNLRLLVELLSESGFNVRPAPNGFRALEAVRKRPPDLILLDILMPKLDGYELCLQLKADERTRPIPVIFISAIDEPFDKVKAFAIGGVDYVTKPLQATEVLARVETHLTIARLQQELHQKNEALAAANETLEEKVEQRTAELAQANRTLQAEIERRISYQQEKDRLFTMVSQQSEQLRQMTTMLIDAQQQERQGLASELSVEIAHKIGLLQASLTSTKQLLNTSQIGLAIDQLEEALPVLAQIERYVSQVTGQLPQPTSHEQDLSQSPLLKLTEREREVFQLLVQGKSSSEISDLLSITAPSVHTYNRRIKDKLDIPDLAGLMKFAFEHNLVH